MVGKIAQAPSARKDGGAEILHGSLMTGLPGQDSNQRTAARFLPGAKLARACFHKTRASPARCFLLGGSTEGLCGVPRAHTALPASRAD
ncbi:hypothetical protein RFN28_05985 [Mesorhizobium sp. VK24D]|uniref:Uncharacterized protein n=1 Tax=Mesorhizobium album TaxID=3072314 RepID=A0ABU4XWM0_9HYPH|nr:hypothetical protein [Mesorhizobium sp. VK24D]MDX8478029.1 hypothetical protein [Mesorhizobium sp. VK24D]